MAPFAFLGPAYDDRLKAIYTGITIHDIAEERSLLSAFYGDAMADNAPLWKLVKKHVTQEMLDAIAAEHEKGRVLLVGTTNLDARRPVIWNITEIAALHLPGALELVQKILIASSAIPGTFPPVMIDVEANGKSLSGDARGRRDGVPGLRLSRRRFDSTSSGAGARGRCTSSATPVSIRTGRRSTVGPCRSRCAPSPA